MNLMESAFSSWSGGKDCCLACYKALSGGLKVRYLLNMVTDDGERSRSHGLAARWLRMQSQAIGILLIQHSTAPSDYEAEFKKVLYDLRGKGITQGVFGDIDVEEHRQWIERVCSEVDVIPRLPLWLEDQRKIMIEFINLGFQAVVVATKADMMGEEWLGRKIDEQFLTDLSGLHNVTLCGEAGEYHTMVIDGPLFERRMEITGANKVQRDGHWFWEIAECRLMPKKDINGLVLLE
ncbi:MAG: diphthine--ammonia ligase [Dehalococcoidia bacterium]|nr:diphthine--ammonia ligase [Dehalococcoidia bacterium]